MFDAIDGLLMWWIIMLTLVSLVTGWLWLVPVIGLLVLIGISREL